MDDICNIPVFDKLDMKQCCGCEGCASACPVSIISFRPDKEGFRYPSINMDECIKCLRCVSVCPALNFKSNSNTNFITVAGYSNDLSILNNSSSGGFFSHLFILFKKQYPAGYVCGVVWNEDFSFVQHIASNEDVLEKMQSSKYIQSRKNLIYKKIKDLLEQGKPVLFIGTGCEVSALHNVLNKEYPLLYTIDLICKGPCSELAFNEYKSALIRKYKSSIKKINMRYVGWKTWIPQWIRIEFSNEKVYKKIFYTTDFGRAFYLMQRKSCSNCSYSGLNRRSDITLGDFHGANTNRKYYNPKGVSVAIANTKKGAALLDALKKEDITYEEVTYDEVAKENPCLVGPVPEKPIRSQFSELLITKGLSDAVKETYPIKEKIINHLPPEFAKKSYEIVHKLKGEYK